MLWLLNILASPEPGSFEAITAAVRDIALAHGLPAGVDVVVDPMTDDLGITYVLDLDPAAGEEQVEALARLVEEATRDACPMHITEVMLGLGQIGA